jgi:hypothetical protein
MGLACSFQAACGLSAGKTKALALGQAGHDNELGAVLVTQLNETDAKSLIDRNYPGWVERVQSEGCILPHCS